MLWQVEKQLTNFFLIVTFFFAQETQHTSQKRLPKFQAIPAALNPF